MNLKVKHCHGSTYSLRDEKIEATADLLGGGDGFLVVLLSIKDKIAEVQSSEVIESAIEHLGSCLKSDGRYREFVIIYKEKIVYSLSAEVPVGPLPKGRANVRQVTFESGFFQKLLTLLTK